MASMDQIVARAPLGRLGTPDDIAAACAFLCSEEAGVHHRPADQRERRRGTCEAAGRSDCIASGSERKGGSMSDVTVLKADRWVDVEAGEVRARRSSWSTATRSSRSTPGAARARPPRSTSATSRSCPADGHGAQHAHRRSGRARRPARPDARREGLAGVPDAARRRELPDHAHGRLHHRAQPRPDGLHGRVPARRRPGQGGRPGVVSRARASSRPATPSPRRAATSTRRCSRGWRRASCPRASSRGSPTACPRCARRSATRSSTAPS